MNAAFAVIFVTAVVGCSSNDSTATVTIELGGNTRGTVTSDPPGIACGSACTLDVPIGTTVTLTATPGDAAVFAGWDASVYACPGEGAPCSVQVTDDVALRAVFGPKLEEVTGGGATARDVDILFVIDNSVTMQEEQQNLEQSFPGFIAALRADGLPNLHLGVVTTDMGTLNVNTGDAACSSSDNGNLHAAGCTNLTGNFINDIVDPGTGQHIVNYSGTLEAAFSCIADVGTNGCGFEQPFEAMRRALDNNPVNAGFLRPLARLAVVFVGDEDDCSADNPAFYAPESPTIGPLDSFRCFEKGFVCDQGSDIALRDVGVKTNCRPAPDSPYLIEVPAYVEFLRALKPNPGDVVVASIMGDRDPVEVGRRTPTGGGPERPDLLASCQYVDGTGITNSADPGIRLDELVGAFGQRGARSTICNEDLSSALAPIADLIINSVNGVSCFQGTLYDSDAAVPGLQPECSFARTDFEGQLIPIPACDNPTAPTNAPCYVIAPESSCASTSSMLGVHFVGEGSYAGGCAVY